MSRRVLITNITLAGRTGSEIVTRDLALGLKASGDRPTVYSPRSGPIAGELIAAGVPVVTDIADAPRPDLIHGHHTIQTAVACARWPDVPCVFLCHDGVAWHDAAPRLANVRLHATVNAAFRDRVAADAGIAADDVLTAANGVDTDRFRPGPDLAPHPRRALAFAKNHGHLEAIAEACAARDIALDVIGAAAGRIEAAPEVLLGDYDLVFTSALSAIEAMAVGRAVVVCDGRGLAGMATSGRHDAWRPLNFGLGAFDQPLTAAAVGAEIDRYDPVDARAVADRIRREAALPVWIDGWRAVHGRLLDLPPPAVSDEDRAAALAAHLQAWDPSAAPAPWLGERAALEAALTRLGSGLEPVSADAVVTADDGGRLSLGGFHPVEAWGGAWSARRQTSIRLQLADDARPTRLGLSLTPLPVPGARPFGISFLINGRPLGQTRLAPGRNAVDFALDLFDGERTLWITAVSDPCTAPADVGLGPDPRPLGFAVHAVSLG